MQRIQKHTRKKKRDKMEDVHILSNIGDEQHSAEYEEPKKHKRKKSRHKTELDIRDEEDSEKPQKHTRKKSRHTIEPNIGDEKHSVKCREHEKQRKKRRHKTKSAIKDEKHSEEPQKHKRKKSRHKIEILSDVGNDEHSPEDEEPQKNKRKKSKYRTESDVGNDEHSPEDEEPLKRKRKKSKHKTESDNRDEDSEEPQKHTRKKSRHTVELKSAIQDKKDSEEPRKHQRKKSRHKIEILSDVGNDEHSPEDEEPLKKKRKKSKYKTESDVRNDEHSPEDEEPLKKKRKKSKHKTEEGKNHYAEGKERSDVVSGCMEEMSVKNEDEGTGSKVVDEETIEKMKHEWQEKTSLKKLRMQQPKLFLIDNFTNDEDPKTTFKPVGMQDLQDLLQYSVMANAASVNRVRFCKLLRPALVEKVVLIILKGVSEEHFQENSACFPYLTANYDLTGRIQQQSQQENIVNQLLYMAISRVEMKKRRYLAKNSGNYRKPEDPVIVAKRKATMTDESGDKPGRTHYLMTDKAKQTWRFPDPGDPTFIHTKYTDTVNDSSPMIGVDCEMCVTKNGSELTRVSLVDEKCNVLYNSLVKPHDPIIDYLTKYSGISKQLLDPVTTRIEDVQRDVVALLPPSAILVGQSVENDLRALKLYHPHVIDTSNMFTGSYRVALSKLALKYLGQKIQASAAGHDSVEDASVCMKLAQLKIAGGEDIEKYTFNNNSNNKETIPTESLFRCAHTLKKVSMLIDGMSVARQYVKDPVGVLPCQSDSEAIKKAVQTLPYSHFVSVQFYNFFKLMQGMSQGTDAVQETLRQLDQRFKKLHKMLPYNCMFLVVMATDPDLQSKKSDDEAKLPPGRFFTGLKVQF